MKISPQLGRSERHVSKINIPVQPIKKKYIGEHVHDTPEQKNELPPVKIEKTQESYDLPEYMGQTIDIKA